MVANSYSRLFSVAVINTVTEREGKGFFQLHRLQASCQGSQGKCSRQEPGGQKLKPTP